VITGGYELEGSVTISGNKNAALPCIAASLLTDQEVILHNIPAIEDVYVMLDLVQGLGSSVQWLGPNTVSLTSSKELHKLNCELPENLVDAIRASILLAGPLVGRTGAIRLAPPGGDVIGFRRLDTHFQAFEALGATCSIDEQGYVHIRAEKLLGNSFFLDEASVTATENIIMAAATAEGTTVVYNAASEPHVQDVCHMLNLMGCCIEGVGSNVLRIEGGHSLGKVEYTIGFDYMEAGSFIGLAAATKGQIELQGIDNKQLPMIAAGFERIGVSWVTPSPQRLIVPKEQNRVMKKSISGQTHKVDDAPWPGFPADLLSIITVTATQMSGSILIHQKMYESRMFFVDWLLKMGADIILCDPHRAVINGPTPLKPAQVYSPDVRAGMALVIAALCAKGTSTIQNIYQIERGYEALVAKLLGVGAHIERID